MEIKLNENCLKIEKDDRVLLFNNRNLEIVLMTKQKFNNGLNEVELEVLKSCAMTEDRKIEEYTLKEVYPEHISKAYLLFGIDCNISCKYCTVKHNAKKYTYKNGMSKETLSKSLDLLFEKNIGLEHITLYGGEPMLHKECLYQFFEYIENLPLDKVPRIDLITNGLILDLKIIELLKKWDVLVLVSLDGNKMHHDTFRLDMSGIGTYDRVVKGIVAYQNAKLRVGVSLVLGRHNYKDVRKICIELKQKYNIVSIGLTLPHMEPDILINKSFEYYLQNQYQEILDICQEQGLWFEQGMKRLLALAEKNRYIYGCPSTSKGSMIRILPGGELTLCENMGLRGLYQIGNVNNDKISMWDILNNEAFKSWYSRCTNNQEKCKTCKAYAICGMGCPYDAYLQNGTIDSIEERNCFISKQAVEWYLDRVIKLAQLPNLEKVKVLDNNERKRVLVDCPWEKKSY